ncbi:hypothetical protein AK812_SmicGene10293 [Symbiodinium microadriaticum]|uniref:Uncharacterized protein n=1 Tax=Symbiodinium microadriaticum TaxID=2951 RepID=A0A1Q9EG65_SYMMI|nr:hypothetical protein AK812_SmicGene10293 [Symbiodinium microadriaticum]
MRTWRIVPRVVVMDGTTLVPHNQVEEATPLGGTARTMDGTQRAMDPAKHPGRLHMGGGAPGVGRLRHLDGMILVGVDIHTGIQLHPLPLVVRDGSGMMEIMVVGVVNLGMQAAVMVGTARTGVMLPLTNKIVSGVRGILYLVVVQINGVPGLKLLVDGVNNGHRLVDKVRNRSAARPPRLRRPREICLAGVLPRLPLARVAGRVLVVSNPLASGKAASGWDANAPALKKGLSGVDKAQYAKPAVGDSDNNGLMGRFAPQHFPVGWTERVMRRSVRVRTLRPSWVVQLNMPRVDGVVNSGKIGKDGLQSDEDVHYMDEDDEAGFLQMGGYAGLDVDTFSLMELTEDEEALLAELHLPDAVRRNLRETLRTLQRHDAEDQGPEYRWSTAEWVASWDQACADVSRVVRCLRRRLGEEGSVEYWPVVRTPRAAAHRVRSLQWARQWTPVVVQILEALVDCHMVQRVDAIPVQPRPRGGPASRSRSRDSPSASSDGPSMGGRPHRVSRARRRVGAGDSGGRATMDTPVPVADNAPGVVRSSLPASTPGPTEENAVGVDDALPTSSLSTSSVGGAAVGGGSSAEVDPTVGVAVDVDGASLVQRLQPGEARELQRLGVRRDTITALGLFLGELASICDGTHPGSDVVPEDVQWALRVVERALFLSAGTQDFIASILAARLQRGRDACVLPDGDGRGGVVQMAHTFMVGAARTYLDDLQNLLADSWVNPESLPEELRREPPGGAAMGGYGDDDDEDDIRPVVVQPLEEGDNVDIPGGAPPGDMGQTLRPVVTSAEDVHAESPGAVLSSAVDPPVAVPSVPVDGATLPAGVADMGATSSWQTPPGRARSRSPRRTEAALEEDVNSHMQLLEDETAELVEVDVPRDLRQSMDVFLAEVAEYVDCPWTLQLSVALVDAMLVQLGVIRCLLARRAGRPSPLPGQDARDQSAAGCAAFCRVLSAAQWESAMAMLRSAQCDPDALPARLHGVPGAGMSATPGSPVLVEGESAASSNAVLPDYLGGGAVDDANMLDAASVP